MPDTPKKTKPAREMTTQEAIDHLFHPKIVEQLKIEIDKANKQPVKKE